MPNAIVSDRGTQFVNAFWQIICKELKIHQRLSTAYHPETDGSTERANEEVEKHLRAFVAYVAYEQHDWTSWIPLAQIAINNKPAKSTQISPFFMCHGYDAELIQVNTSKRPLKGSPAYWGKAVVDKLKEAHQFAKTSMVVAQQDQEKYTNRKRDEAISHKVGDKVWLNLKKISTDRPSKKLDWIHAKYTVTKTFSNSPHFYELDTPRGIHNKIYTSLLRPAGNNPLPSQMVDDMQPSGLQTSDGDTEYGIEEILDVRTRKIGRGKREEALVKWTGYAIPKWHPLKDFNGTITLEVYEKEKKKEKKN